MPKSADPDGLTDMQRAFVREYLVDLSPGAAARRAGFSSATASQQGYAMRKNLTIRAAIEQELAKRKASNLITQERVLTELARIAFFDPRRLLDDDGNPIPLHRLDADTAAVIGALEIEDIFEGRGDGRRPVGVVRKYKIADKMAAITNLMKHLGMLSDRVVLQGDADKPVQVQHARASLAEVVAQIQLKKALE